MERCKTCKYFISYAWQDPEEGYCQAILPPQVELSEEQRSTFVFTTFTCALWKEKPKE